MAYNPKSAKNLTPVLPGEVRNPGGRKGKTSRQVSFNAVLKAADKLTGASWSDPDYCPGSSTHMALVNWIEGDDVEDADLREKLKLKRRDVFFKDIFPKTIQPPSEESAEIDFTDTEAAIAAIMAQYISDPGFFRKVMEKAVQSQKLRPVVMDLTAMLHVFAVPTDAKEITDAVPVTEPEEMDVRKQAQDGEGMGETYPEREETPGEEG